MELFSLENALNLGVLIFLQAVLGFDNLLYISIESQRAPAEDQARVRKLGITIALVLRVVLLFLIMSLLQNFSAPLFSIHCAGVLEGEFNFSTIVFLLGGGFLMYTAVKEIFHMLGTHDLSHGDSRQRSVGRTIFWIVLMNLIFSFDSILSAMALAKDEETGKANFLLMAIAIVSSGLLMIWLSDRVATFLQKNRMYEVLGLFVLFIVGVMLLTEGAHLAHLHLGGNPITPMTKTTFYFVIGVLVLTDIVQGRYQKKILRQQALASRHPGS